MCEAPVAALEWRSVLQTSDESEGRAMKTEGADGQNPDVVPVGELVALPDGKGRSEAVRFAYEVAALKLRLEGYGERMIDRHALYRRVVAPAEQRA